MIQLILILIAGVSVVAYTIHLLNTVPLQSSDNYFYKFRDEKGELHIHSQRKRYYRGGRWWKRSSWSNIENGERGATVPDKYTHVFMPDYKNYTINAPYIRRLLSAVFPFVKKPKSIVHSITFGYGCLITMQVDLVIWGDLFMPPKPGAYLDGPGTLVFIGTGKWTCNNTVTYTSGTVTTSEK